MRQARSRGLPDPDNGTGQIDGYRQKYHGVVKLACFVAFSTVVMPCVHAQRGKTTRVDETFDGRRVVLRAGEVLQVTLPENGSTGYQWGIPPGLKRKFAPTIREREQTVQAPDGPPGSPGLRHLYFEAVRTGSAELELHYRRPWERDTPPARRFRLHILVRRSSGS